MVCSACIQNVAAVDIQQQIRFLYRYIYGFPRMPVPYAYPFTGKLVYQVVGIHRFLYYGCEIRFEYEAEVVHYIEPVDPGPRVAGLYHRVHYVGHRRKLNADNAAALRQPLYIRVTPVEAGNYVMGGYADAPAIALRLLYCIDQHLPVREPSVVCEFPAVRPEPFDFFAAVEIRHHDLFIKPESGIQPIEGNAYVGRALGQPVTPVPYGMKLRFIHR